MMRRNMMMMRMKMMTMATTMTMILGALVIMPSIRWPMAEPAAIRERIDRPTPAWMSCKIIMIIMMLMVMVMTMMMMVMMMMMILT